MRHRALPLMVMAVLAAGCTSARLASLSAEVRRSLARPSGTGPAMLTRMVRQITRGALRHPGELRRRVKLLAMLSQHGEHRRSSLRALEKSLARLESSRPGSDILTWFNQSLAAAPIGGPRVSSGSRFAAASNARGASRAALEVLEAGGNAVDGAVAAMAALWVADPANISPLGRSEWIIHLPDREPMALSAGTRFPASVRTSWRRLPRREGWAAVPIPGNLAAVRYLVRHKLTSLPLRRLFAPAIRLARDGFVLLPTYETMWDRAAEDLREDPETARTYLKPGGKPYLTGERFRNPGLARFLERMATAGGDPGAGIDSFYKGALGKTFVEKIRRGGGHWTTDDLSDYRAKPVPLWKVRLGDYEILTPRTVQCRGYLLLEMLQILQAAFEMKILAPGDGPLSPREAEALLLIEILATLDTRYKLGLYVTPREEAIMARIISRGHARRRARDLKDLLDAPVDKLRAFLRKHRLLRKRPRGRDRDTTSWTVSDGRGWVQVTGSIGPWFGAKRAVGGVLAGYSYRMAKPSKALQLIGYDQTAQAPTIVRRGGRPILAIGAAGSRRIIGSIFHTLALRLRLRPRRRLDWAIASPRLYPRFGRIRTHLGFGAKVLAHLRRRGYGVRVTGRGVKDHLGIAAAIEREPGGRLRVVIDPASNGAALAR